MVQVHEAFSVANGKISAWDNTVVQLVGNFFTGGVVKLNHDIPAQNRIILLIGRGICNQVEFFKGDMLHHFFFYFDKSGELAAAPLKEPM